MDQGPPEGKRLRLFGSHIDLLHPTPSPTHSTGQLAQHPPPPPGQYHPPPPHAYSRPPDLHPPPHTHPPPQPHHPPHISIPHQPPPPPPPPPPHQGPNHIEDRRHHEQDRYPPMQEHRQPPPSPAHAQYPYMRDAMVKPDPGDDALPQLRRPHSTGNAPEALAGTSHSGLPHPPPAAPEDRRHMSYDAGHQPPMYRQPSYPPQTPTAHGTPYDYGSSYGPSHHEMAQYGIPIAASGKRKAQRASQACDSCRQLKAKCDELKPCKSCKEKKLECKYRDPAPKVQDKVSADILEALLDFRGVVEQRLSYVLHVNTRLAEKMGYTLDSLLRDDGNQRPIPAAAEGATSYSPENITNSTEMEVDIELRDGLKVETEVEPQIPAAQARDTLRELAKDEELDEEPPGPPVTPGQPAIPLNHTTLASRLLKWKAIKQLVHHLLAKEVKYEDEFPIQQEEQRGLLRLFGRGEGQGNGDNERESSVDQGSVEAYSEYPETGAPSPADCWGSIGGLTSPVARDVKGVVNVPTLDFTEAIVWKYVHSYQDNIQNMHPLIIPGQLKAMVSIFLDNVHRSTARRQNKQAGFTDARDARDGTVSQYHEIGNKRKRSPGVDASDTPPGVSPMSSSTKPVKPVFERSIQNALVLLVLALGKICLWKERIPEVVPVTEPNPSSPVIRNGHALSPIQGSPPAYAPMPLSSALPSPKEFSTSRRGSFQSGTNVLPRIVPVAKRNLDVIPGLDYFATATDILGGQLAGTTLKHVYANILAGLYYGQLGRVIESYTHIQLAGHTLQKKMRPHLDRLSKLNNQLSETPGKQSVIKSLRDNLLVYAFWSCLQLESDIIAELPLPQSGILALEDLIPYPNQYLASQYGFDPRVLSSFSAQLYLRKNLNLVHQLLYDPSKSQQEPQGSLASAEFDIYSHIEEALDLRFVPPEFKFSMQDPPATDILSARLRAKYWGARMITFRPFIRQILHFNESRNAVISPGPISGDFKSGIAVPTIGPDATSESDIDPIIIENAKKGVKALIESTKAFHGLGPQRFIITNVFGTAHAQWGNLLVLSAAYKDPILTRFIPESLLRDLLSRTIAFFRMVAHSTSALAIDMRILQGLERELFYSRAELPGPNSSFSSTTTSDTLTLAPMVSTTPGSMQAPNAPRDAILPAPSPMHHPS